MGYIDYNKLLTVLLTVLTILIRLTVWTELFYYTDCCSIFIDSNIP